MNKIPKLLHYCWFGNGEKNDLIKKCMNSWKRYLPDFEIIEWNERNFDITQNLYVKQAYERKKWAFVSDYVRLKVLYKYGGVYVDTDLEITNSIEKFLEHKVFTSHENDSMIPTAIIGSCANHEWIGYLLTYYDNNSFIKEDGSEDLTTNVTIITNMTKEKYNLKFNNTFINFGDDVNIYPKEYFCVKDENYENYAIHHFNGSWIPANVYKNSYLILNKLLNEKYGDDEVTIGRYIKNNNFNNFAIYGGGNIGKLIIEILKNQKNITPKFIIDEKLDKKFFNEIPIIKIKDIKDYKKNLELIIVTPTYYYEEINSKLHKIVEDKVKIISINEILKLNLP